MKKISYPVVAFALIIASCTHADKKHEHGHGMENEPKTLIDSLEKDIDEGHIVGMSKIGKLHNTKKEVQLVIDSISALPAKAKEALTPYLEQLQSAIKDIDYADFAMDKWMTENEHDSPKNDTEKRTAYLRDERDKVSKMKDAILNSISKADSLLKVKMK